MVSAGPHVSSGPQVAARVGGSEGHAARGGASTRHQFPRGGAGRAEGHVACAGLPEGHVAHVGAGGAASAGHQDAAGLVAHDGPGGLSGPLGHQAQAGADLRGAGGHARGALHLDALDQLLQVLLLRLLPGLQLPGK